MPEREPQHGAGEVDAIAGARSVTDEFLATFNAGDAAAHAATLAYPHVRLASGTVRVWATFDEAHAAMTLAMPALRERAGHRDIIHVGPGKVHLDVQFTRYRSDGSVIGVYPAVYVIVEQDGAWRIQCRSSFAP